MSHLGTDYGIPAGSQSLSFASTLTNVAMPIMPSVAALPIPAARNNHSRIFLFFPLIFQHFLVWGFDQIF